MEVGFYHVTRGAAETALPSLVVKALRAGHRVAVRSGDAERLKRVDALLWTYDAASFLPHAAEPCAHAERQPVLLTAAERPANGADVLVLLDGAVPREGFARVLYVFGEDQREVARAAWRGVEGPRTYWQQTEAGWEERG